MDFRKKSPIILFLPILRILIPERAQWNGGVLQRQRGIPIFTDKSKLGGGTGAVVFRRELGPEFHFMLNDNCNVIESLAGDPTSDSYMILVDS